jgi:hypothetical protein
VYWEEIQIVQVIEDLALLSNTKPCLIFKHRTRSDLSAMTYVGVWKKLDFTDLKIAPFLLDLVAFPSLARLVAK